MIGSIDDLIGKRANARHRFALAVDRREQSLTFFGRMRTARFAEAILQNVVRGFEEKHGDFQTRSSQRVELFFEVGEKLTFANVDDERRAADALFVFVSRDEPCRRSATS